MAKGSKSGGGGNNRSAITGRYVTPQHAARNPKTTLQEAPGGGSTDRHRSADTGRFVTEDYARRNPRTTVKES